MDIIFIFKNLLDNIIGIFLYMMPFGIFDSASYFIDLYGSPLYITGLFILSLIMGVVFLTYFFEIFNIPIDTEGVSGLRGKETDVKSSKKEVTFLSETLRFVFGQSNFGTYKPVVVLYFGQLRMKIVPIFIVLLLLYSSLLPTSRGYNTVGEFYYANSDYIYYQILGDNYISKDEIDNKLKFDKYLEDNGSNNPQDGAYTDKSYLLKSLSEDTIRNKKLNEAIEKEIVIYKNIYDEKTYNEYIGKINTKIKLKKAQIKNLENKKETQNLSKNDLSSLINNLNVYKNELKNLESTKNNIKIVYKNLSHSFEEALGLDPKVASAKKSKLELEYSIYDRIINFSEGKMNGTSLNHTFDNSINEIQNVISGNQEKTNGSNDILIKVNTYIEGIGLEKDKINSELSGILNKLKEAKLQLLKDKEKINKGYYKSELSKILNDIRRLNDNISNVDNIKTDEKARIDYIARKNAEELRSKDWENDKEGRQSLLLLQYKLIAENNGLNKNFEDTLYLFGNRVEYIGINVFESFGLIMLIITVLFKIIYYSAIVFMAGWKNMFILYVASMSWLARKMTEYIGEDRSVTQTLQNHLSAIQNHFNGDGEIDPKTGKEIYKDKEMNWFTENSNKQETYLIMALEFFLRLGFIYWLLNM